MLNMTAIIKLTECRNNHNMKLPPETRMAFGNMLASLKDLYVNKILTLA